MWCHLYKYNAAFPVQVSITSPLEQSSRKTKKEHGVPARAIASKMSPCVPANIHVVKMGGIFRGNFKERCRRIQRGYTIVSKLFPAFLYCLLHWSCIVLAGITTGCCTGMSCSSSWMSAASMHAGMCFKRVAKICPSPRLRRGHDQHSRAASRDPWLGQSRSHDQCVLLGKYQRLPEQQHDFKWFKIKWRRFAIWAFLKFLPIPSQNALRDAACRAPAHLLSKLSKSC